jgi:hypothetical protein
MNFADKIEIHYRKIQAINKAEAQLRKERREADAAIKALAAEEASSKKVPIGRLRARLKKLTGEDADVEFTREGRKTVDVWAYHYGFQNSAMGPGCHLIHEDSVEEVYAILADGLEKCNCLECRPAVV